MPDPLGRKAPTRHPDSAPWRHPLAPDLEAHLADEITRLRSSGWSPPPARRPSYAGARVFGDARDALADLIQRQIDDETALRAEAWRRIATGATPGPAGHEPPALEADTRDRGDSSAEVKPGDERGLLFGSRQIDAAHGTVDRGLLSLASYGDPTKSDGSGAPGLRNGPRQVQLAMLPQRDPITGMPCPGAKPGGAEVGPLGCSFGGGGFGGALGGGGAGLGLLGLFGALLGGAGQTARSPSGSKTTPHQAGGGRYPQRFDIVPDPVPKPPDDFEPPDAEKEHTETLPQVPTEATRPSPLPAPPEGEPTVLIFPDMSHEFADLSVLESHPGNAQTRNHVLQVEAVIKNQHPEWKQKSGGSLKEKAIRGPAGVWQRDGRKGSRLPDLLFEAPDGKLVAINTVTVDENDQVTDEELQAAESLRRQGITVYLIKKPHQLKTR